MKIKHPPRPRERKAIKAWNRQKIIDATIATINTRGIAGTTVARVVELAEVSMGMVNLHFENKERLLEAVLEHMSLNYDLHFQQAYQAAAESIEEQLRALILVDLHPAVLNLETLGIWYAFRAQARNNPQFIALVGNRSSELSALYKEIFTQLNLKHKRNHSPAVVTQGLIAMLEGVWADFFLYPEEYNRMQVLTMLSMFLEGLYPQRFNFEIE